jgi:hypothetical protein
MLAFLGWAATASAVDLDGSFRLWAGPLDIDGDESDQLDQKYTLNLSQDLSPWLRLTFSYRYNELEDRREDDEIFRRSTEPLLQLTYEREEFSARFVVLDRELRSSIEAQNLDIRSYLSQLDWRPRRDLRTFLRYQDDSNVADVGIFGRETDSTLLDWTTLLERQHWSARYSFRDSSIDNRLTGLRFDQEQHELRLDYGQRLWRDRLFLSADALLGQTEQRQEIPAGSELAQPISARRGLFALDTSPEVGELESQPQLTDGDLTSPVLPPIDIGGGNTFRNLGLDLGTPRPASRLEVTVESPSDPGLRWEVYHGPDNLNWVPIAGVVSEFDASLLRYTLRFPETTDRYFKAVNVSANSRSQVQVTELRALLDVERLGREEDDSTTYRANLFVSYDASERVNLTVGANFRNEEDLAGGILSREIEEQAARTGVRILLATHWTLRLGYDLTNYEEKVGVDLERQEEIFNAALEWAPLETVDVSLSATSREDRDSEVLIRATDNLRLRALTELLPGLNVTSELSWSETDDPFFGFQQSTWSWLESFDSQPTSRWRLGGLFSYTSYDTTGVFTLTRRTRAYLTTRWAVTPFLSLGGSWDFADDDRLDTLTQIYNLAWAPGQKLAVALTYQDTDSDEIRQTTSSSGSVTYRLNRWFTIWLSLSSSAFDELGAEISEIRSARIGMNLLF